jgi:plastocyanin
VTGPALHLAYTNLTIGVGQVFQSQYVYVDNPVAVTPLVIHLAKSDSALAPASQAFLLDRDSVVIPVGGTASYQSGSTGYVNVTGNTIATAQLIARASGYGQVTTTVAVGQPQLNVPTNLSMYVGQQPYLSTVTTLDQNGLSRVVAAPLTVTDSSTDSTVAKVLPPSTIVPALQYYAYDTVRAVSKGAVSIVYRAPGYKSDTTVVSVDTATLVLNGNTGATGLGPGQLSTGDLYVQLPYSSESSLVVSLNSSNSAAATVPATVTIPAGGNYFYVPVTGVGSGSTNITATAPHSHAATGVSVLVSKPRLQISFTTSVNAGQKNTVTVYAQDSTGAHNRVVTAPVTVTLVSSDPTHTTFDSSTITIPVGGYYAQTGVAFDTAGTYTLTATNAAYISGVSSTVTATGALVKMLGSHTFSAPTITIPAGQYVTWRNADVTTHTATSDTNISPAFNTGSVTQGSSATVYFGTAGTYYYHCQFHGVSGNGTAPGTGMVGTIIVQ